MKNYTFHRLLRYLFVMFCLCIALAGCSDEEPTPEPTVAPTAAPTVAPTAAQAESPLNAPNSPLSSPVPTPTPVAAAPAETVAIIPPVAAPVDPKTTATMGAATGRIFINNEHGFKPVTGVIVALAAVITGDDGVERAAGYDAANAPRNDIRDDGTFVIENVPPGRYGVILDSVMAQVLIKDPENLENSLVITVEAGKVTDLRNLIYASLPLPDLAQ